MCKQQSCRSACTDVQADLDLCCLLLLGSMKSILDKSRISQMQLVSVPEKASLNLTKIPKTHSCIAWLNCIRIFLQITIFEQDNNMKLREYEVKLQSTEDINRHSMTELRKLLTGQQRMCAR